MKQIEGVTLSNIVSEVRAERLEHQKKEVAKQVHGIYNNIHSMQTQKASHEAQAKKLGEKITKSQERLVKIEQGDWSVLEEEKPEKTNNKESD